MQPINGSIPVIELQKHWRTLRDTYVRKQRYMKEALQLPNGAESRVSRRIMAWPFYERMSFLSLFIGENSASRRYRTSPKREPATSPKLELPCNSEKEEKQVKENENGDLVFFDSPSELHWNFGCYNLFQTR
ncbi:hypothetical protein ANCCAN_29470 [Ancylostoma caninum]|uniref:MADF domain-containing protein n=1 Tax=Ancylostoma caninum TaxID=29170 RepID=A0A368EYG8_ANCCA|nr:hypothetical protein ANCCAN_29470 [Ancylostoma caninum]